MAILAPACGPDRLAPIAALDRSASDNGAPNAPRLLQVRQLSQMHNHDGPVILAGCQ